MKKQGTIAIMLCIFLFIGAFASWAWGAQTVKGVVFWDKNGNGIQDDGEPGLPNVSISN
jgi:hypothetical protein